MAITCEGCGAKLDNYNSLTKEWMEVSTERPHDCPQKEKLRAALRERRAKMKKADANVEKYAVQIIICRQCGAKYSNILKKCPQCKNRFIESLFREPH